MSELEIKNGILKKYTGSKTDVIVPDGVREIGEGAFSETDIERIHLPDSLRVIHHEAFALCLSLSEINLPNSIEHIGNATFHSAGLSHVRLPNQLVEIPEELFAYSNLQHISLPECVSNICDGAFEGCMCLETVNFPDGLKHIRSRAFAGDYALSSIHLPPEAAIDGSAFRFCNSLADEDGFIVVDGMLFQSPAFYQNYEVTFPNSVRVIKRGSVDIRRDLDGVVWAANRNELWEARRKNVGSVIRIPASVVLIEPMAFCGDILHIVSDSTTTFGPWTLFSCDKLESLTVPRGTIISDKAFGPHNSDLNKLRRLKIIYK